MRSIIPDRLWIGNAGDLRDVGSTLGCGVLAVVDLAANEPRAAFPRDVIYCRLPLCDGADNAAAMLRMAITTTAELIRAEVPTMVACSMGMSRSPAIVAAALAQVRGRSCEAMLAEIALAGSCDVDPALWNDVQRTAATIERFVAAPQPAVTVHGATLSLLVVRTMQVDSLIAFYQSLGLRFTEERHGRGPLHHSATLDDTVFEVYPAAKPEDVDASTRLGFRIDDPAKVVELLRAAGATIVAEPKPTEWGLRAVVRDPDGRAVELSAMIRIGHRFSRVIEIKILLPAGEGGRVLAVG